MCVCVCVIWATSWQYVTTWRRRRCVPDRHHCYWEQSTRQNDTHLNSRILSPTLICTHVFFRRLPSALTYPSAGSHMYSRILLLTLICTHVSFRWLSYVLMYPFADSSNILFVLKRTLVLNFSLRTDCQKNVLCLRDQKFPCFSALGLAVTF